MSIMQNAFSGGTFSGAHYSISDSNEYVGANSFAHGRINLIVAFLLVKLLRGATLLNGLNLISRHSARALRRCLFLTLAGFATAGSGIAAPAAAPPDSVTVLAAGDIAQCPPIGATLTAQLLDQYSALVLAVGDLVYPYGEPKGFRNCYGPTWGRHKERTYPVPGNHEYVKGAAIGYFQYWKDRATPVGKSYYSFDLASWHVVALDSNLNAEAASEQERWLRADLARSQSRCILGFWHHTIFSSGWHGQIPETLPLFQAMYDAGATIVITGHDHHYERFAPQNPDGRADNGRGIRAFVVGTGGAKLHDIAFRKPNSETYNSETWGVLKLTLRTDSYDWEFIPAVRTEFHDAGHGVCVDRNKLIGWKNRGPSTLTGAFRQATHAPR